MTYRRRVHVDTFKYDEWLCPCVSVERHGANIMIKAMIGQSNERGRSCSQAGGVAQLRMNTMKRGVKR